MLESKVHDRIGLKEFNLEELSGNRCSARAILAWPEGDDFVGTAYGKDTEMGRLWCAAEATTRAVELSVNREIALAVVGVQKILEDDTLIIVTLLSGRVLGEEQRLTGSCIIGEQPARSAALSVLKATNRLMGGVIFSLSG